MQIMTLDGNSVGEEALIEPLSIEDYEAFFNALDKEIITSINDIDGTIIYVNDNFAKISKYPREELIGQNPRILKSGFHNQEFYKDLWSTILSGKVWRGEIKNKAKDNSFYWLDTTIIPVLDENGVVKKFFTLRYLITEHKRMEEIQRESQYARSLIEASLDPLVTINLEGKITDVNEASVKVTGFSREELIGTDFFRYFTEPKKAREGYEQALSKGSVADYPLTIRHKNGQLTDVLYNASVYKDLGGKVLGVFVAARDVTEFKKVMNEYIETKNFLDNILQSSIKYSIIGTDLDGNILSWNEGAAKNYGYKANDIIGKNCIILFKSDEFTESSYKDFLKNALDKGMFEGEFNQVRKDGTSFLSSLVITPRKDNEGKPLGFLLMSHDISEKKLVEEQIIQASQYARSLIEASLDPLVTISPDGKITDVNEASVRVTGIPREKLIGTDFSDYFTEPEKAREGYQQVFAKGSFADFPLTICHIDGHLTDVVYNASVYKDAQGKTLGVFAAARDVTAQKKAEMELAGRLAELEKFQKITVGRELRMIELKNEINELTKEIEELKRKKEGGEK